MKFGIGRLTAALRKAFQPAGSVPVGSAFWGWLREPFAGAWQQGVTPGNTETLLAFGAVYACVRLISSDIAKLPLKLMQQAGDVWVEASPTSPYQRALTTPNDHQTRIQFIYAWMLSKLMYGNTFVLKLRKDQRGIATDLHTLHPRMVTPIVAEDGSVYYRISGDVLAEMPNGATVPASEIIHDRGPTLFHPLVGVSPIYACGMSATQGGRIQANSVRFFENMSRPSGVLTAPNTIKNETAERIKRDWEEKFQGGNIGRLAVLGDGLHYEAMTVNAVDAQLIEQLRWSGEDVARAFGVPGYKIGIGPLPLNNNVEALEQQYYSGTLQELISSCELLLTQGLGLPPGMRAEFDLDGLLRMDSATMYDSLNKAVGGGWMAPNEARARVNLKPVAGGDSPYMQQQQYSLAALAARDADKPFAKPAAPTPAAPPAGNDPGAGPPPAPDPGVKALLDSIAVRLDALDEGEDDNAPLDPIVIRGLQATFRETLRAPR